MPGGVRMKPVKVVVIGDEGVGKTSLVIAAVNESFPDKCPPVVPAAILPAEYTQEGVPLQITDTSSNLEERASLEQLSLGADVVMLVFDTARPQSLNRVSSYWMPELRRIGVHVPVILVGAKSDISRIPDVSSVARPILSKFREIECVYDCSAKRLDNVSDVFYFALKAVTYPVAPVFDPHANDGQGALKPLCVRALKRVFLMNDKDKGLVLDTTRHEYFCASMSIDLYFKKRLSGHIKDGALSDAELNAFQVRCFATPLQPEELVGIRRVVRDEMPQGVSAAGLTLPGFLFLHAMFIERGRLETVWTVLRKYGYNDSLRLSEEHLSEVNFTRAPDQVVEMTETCRKFFSQKFVEYDRDGDKLLSVSEQADMFSIAPAGPWKSEEYRGLLVETSGEGSAAALTLPGFLAKWAFTTAHDPVRTLAYARYLGFEGPGAALFNVSKSRKQERRTEQLQRSVLQVHVFLAGDAGRGLLPRGLAGKFESPTDAGTTSSTSVAAGEVAAGDSSASRSCTLILREDEHKALQALEKDPEVLIMADVAAFTFSSGSVHSFRQAHEMLQRAAHASGETLPCVLVAIEDEQGMPEEVVDECGSVCAELELRQPLTVNPATKSDIPPLLQAFVQAAARPEKSLAIPQTPSLKARKQYHRALKSAALYTAGGIAGGLLCYAVYRAYTSRHSSTDELSSSRESPVTKAQL